MSMHDFLSTHNERHKSPSEVVSYTKTQFMLQNMTEKHNNRDPEDVK
jgi:hypothetical protein